MNNGKSVKVVNPRMAAANVSAFDAVTVLNEIVNAAQDYLNTRQEEATKQAAIRARKEVELREIHDKSALFMTYLHRSFDERQRNFEELFAALDKAMETGGDVGSVLGAITTLAASGPFKDLHDIELVRRNLSDPDHVWTV
ncbi:hypothetical protein ACX1DX_12065 [Tessaracoccus sp. Y36]